MPRQTFAVIDTEALRHNYRMACDLAGTAKPMAVIKADGYGHGLVRVARALAGDAGRFAVACLEEAELLRAAGLEQPVLLLQGVHEAADLSRCETLGLEVAIHSHQQLQWLADTDARPVLWLKVNSGMNRLGFTAAELPAIVPGLADAGFTLRGMMTHFACADDAASDRSLSQTRVFEAATAAWPGLWRSVGNSAAHFRPGQPLYDWSRPGIMLYGSSPMIGQQGPEAGLKAVMTLQSRLISVRTLAPGDTVGYGDSWRADAPAVMGMVSIGYGDGYPRHAGTGTPVWVRGQRARLIGRVSMDMLAVDLTAIPGAEAGDMVELWGANISVDEVAVHAGTISYELLTGVTARVPRLEAGTVAAVSR